MQVKKKEVIWNQNKRWIRMDNKFKANLRGETKPNKTNGNAQTTTTNLSFANWLLSGYLQFFELLKLGEEAGWQLTDTIFVGFQLNQMN